MSGILQDAGTQARDGPMIVRTFGVAELVEGATWATPEAAPAALFEYIEV